MTDIDLTLLPDFIEEAGYHLEDMESFLLKLGDEPDNKELLDEIFRTIHTIKGGAQFIGTQNIGTLSHRMEDLLDAVRQGEIALNQDLVDTLIEGRDRIAQLIKELEAKQAEATPVDDLVELLDAILSGELFADSEANQATTPEAAIGFSDSVTEAAGQATQIAEEIISDDVSDDDFDPEAFDPGDFSEEDFTTEASFPEEAIAEEYEADSENGVASDETAGVPSDEEQPPTQEQEEHDRELYEIFLTHLQEQAAQLTSYSDAIDQGEEDIGMLLIDCQGIVSSLRSSANYMDYSESVKFYDAWLEDIETAFIENEAGEPPMPGFILVRLQGLQGLFPELALQTEKAGAGENWAIDEAEEESGEQEEMAEAFEPAIDSAEMPPVEFPPEMTADFAEEGTSKDSEVEDDAAAGSTDIPDLFSQLRHALEEEESDETQEYEALSAVFTETLSTLEQAAAVPASSQEEEAQQTSPEPDQTEEQTDEVAATTTPRQDEPTTTVPSSSAKPITEKTEEGDGESKEEALKKAIEVTKASQKNTERISKKSVIRVDAEKIDTLMNQVGELVVDRSYFFQLFHDMRNLMNYLKDSGLSQKDLKLVRGFTYRLGEAITGFGRTTNELQERVMKVRMLPVSHLFNRYPRVVRDLSRANNKAVQLVIRGEETELDKMVVEELADPLVHIIRNAIDHGIETREERLAAGKPESGTLTLEAFQEGNHIVIEITDNGRGINLAKVKEKALKMGMTTPDELERLSKEEIVRLVTAPGFTTAGVITDTSGRGVGMDVVKRQIETLNGTLEINSEAGLHTQIRLKIPLTLAIIPGLMIRVGTSLFTIPLANVEESLRIEDTEMSSIEGADVIHLRGGTIPIFRLSNLFNIPADSHQGQKSFVIVVNSGGRHIGLVVDELLGQDEAVIKPLADFLQEKSGFSGATVIGDGRISLILDVYAIEKMAIAKQVKLHRRQNELRKSALEKKKPQERLAALV